MRRHSFSLNHFRSPNKNKFLFDNFSHQNDCSHFFSQKVYEMQFGRWHNNTKELLQKGVIIIIIVVVVASSSTFQRDADEKGKWEEDGRTSSPFKGVSVPLTHSLRIFCSAIYYYYCSEAGRHDEGDIDSKYWPRLNFCSFFWRLHCPSALSTTAYIYSRSSSSQISYIIKSATDTWGFWWVHRRCSSYSLNSLKCIIVTLSRSNNHSSSIKVGHLSNNICCL